jgi:hypothetical protein
MAAQRGEEVDFSGMIDSLADCLGFTGAPALQGAAPCIRTSNILAALPRDASKID